MKQQMPMFELRGLSYAFSRRGGEPVRALDGVQMQLRAGEILRWVGESGSGKSTLGRLLAGLYQPAPGQLFYQGADVCSFSAGQRKARRREVQLLFQSASASLSPRMRVWQSLCEPFAIAHTLGAKSQRKARAAELLRMVGLPEELLFRYPAELSGGPAPSGLPSPGRWPCSPNTSWRDEPALCPGSPGAGAGCRTVCKAGGGGAGLPCSSRTTSAWCAKSAAGWA